jgi:uncharacterized membrane protein
MNRTILTFLVAIAAVAGILFFILRPEPTPQERLADAAEQAADAARDAAREIADAASDAGNTVRQDLDKAAGGMSESLADAAEVFAEQIAEASDTTRDRIIQVKEELRSRGAVTDEGIDFDAAIDFVEASDLTADIKADLVAFLEQLRDTPDALTAQIQAFEKALAQN